MCLLAWHAPKLYPCRVPCPQHAGSQPMVAATLVLLGWNLISWPPEVLLLKYAQSASPALAADKPASSQAAAHSGSAAAAEAAETAGGGKVTQLGSSSRSGLQRQLAAWSLYARQPAAAAALALALLYLTVLSFGTLMTAYLKALGMPEAELAVYRG